jgi:SAM-dependent methyltransferase
MDDPVARLASYYSEQAEVWERRLAGLLHPLGLRLLEGLPTDRAQVILDLGTGSGTLLPAISARAAQALVVGIDRAEGMVRRADPSFARAVGDAARLPLADASVDAAVLAFMLFHLPEPDAGLREVHRALRPGGALAVSTWTAADPPANDDWAQILDAHGARPDEVPARHHLMDTPGKVDALLRRAGFETVDTAVEREPDVMSLEEFLWRRTTVGSGDAAFGACPPRPARHAWPRPASGSLGLTPVTSPIRKKPCSPGPSSPCKELLEPAPGSDRPCWCRATSSPAESGHTWRRWSPTATAGVWSARPPCPLGASPASPARASP